MRVVPAGAGEANEAGDGEPVGATSIGGAGGAIAATSHGAWNTARRLLNERRVPCAADCAHGCAVATAFVTSDAGIDAPLSHSVYVPLLSAPRCDASRLVVSIVESMT